MILPTMSQAGSSQFEKARASERIRTGTIYHGSTFGEFGKCFLIQLGHGIVISVHLQELEMFRSMSILALLGKRISLGKRNFSVNLRNTGV
jgi:hypothetical protein